MICGNFIKPSASPPARVAWIETKMSVLGFPPVDVATREGGVDRNMFSVKQLFDKRNVATREGGVDRNWKF